MGFSSFDAPFTLNLSPPEAGPPPAEKGERLAQDERPFLLQQILQSVPLDLNELPDPGLGQLEHLL